MKKIKFIIIILITLNSVAQKNVNMKLMKVKFLKIEI